MRTCGGGGGVGAPNFTDCYEIIIIINQCVNYTNDPIGTLYDRLPVLWILRILQHGMDLSLKVECNDDESTSIFIMSNGHAVITFDVGFVKLNPKINK